MRSFLVAENGLEHVEIVPSGERLEAYPALATPEKAAQHLFQERLETIEIDRVEDLPADRLVCPKTAADENVVTIHAFTAELRLRAEQADVAHVMLGAGVRAAGEMDVHGLVELDPLVEIVGELEGMSLRI